MDRRYSVLFRHRKTGEEIERVVSANTRNSAAGWARFGLRQKLGGKHDEYYVAHVRYVPPGDSGACSGKGPR